MKLLCYLPSLILFAGASDPAQAQQHNDTTTSKKDQYLLAKKQSSLQTGARRRRRQQILKRKVGKVPRKVINVYNQWTREIVPLDAGITVPPADEFVNQFLRCHFTNQLTQMDPRLFKVLLLAAEHFRADRVNVISGFRSPKYNLTLRKKGRQVARNSEHTLGHAIDFRIPNVSTRALRRWARKLRLGGVGFYKHSRFIHVDVGLVRYWQGR